MTDQAGESESPRHRARDEDSHGTPRRTYRFLTPSFIVSSLALLIATSSSAYALVALGKGDVKTRHLAHGAVTTPKLHKGAVTSRKVKNFSLRLVDLGGLGHLRKRTTNQALSIGAGECRLAPLALDNPASPGLIGSLVVGYVTDADGDAVLTNSGVVAPTVISETSQGGAITNLVVCASSPENVPAGSIFHYQVIGPGK